MRTSVFEVALGCLQASDPDAKVRLTERAVAAWDAGVLEPTAAASPPEPIADAGRPGRPLLVHPRDLPRRPIGSPEGRAALLHAVTHIELNAINLAWDAVYRFRGLPRRYYADWVAVAGDEAAHFRLLRGRLRELGWDYGDFPAHQGLWDMARRTAHDVLARMALIPRGLEARGLDVTPGMMRRFRAQGDDETAERLAVILREEEAHVAAGSRWFRFLCEKRGLEPDATYFGLLDDFLHGEVRCPLAHEARRRAGFSEAELVRLEALCAGRRSA